MGTTWSRLTDIWGVGTADSSQLQLKSSGVPQVFRDDRGMLREKPQREWEGNYYQYGLGGHKAKSVRRDWGNKETIMANERPRNLMNPLRLEEQRTPITEAWRVGYGVKTLLLLSWWQDR